VIHFVPVEVIDLEATAARELIGDRGLAGAR
jgi:hypothetical protein